MKFKIIIEEQIHHEFEVEASDMEEAREIAKNKYYDGKIAFEQRECLSKLMLVLNEDETGPIKWTEF